MAKKYGGKIEGALNIPERERSVNNLKKDDKYFFNVDSESGNIEVFRRRPSGQITQQGETTITYDEVKVGDYDAKEGELSYVDGAANTEEKEFFSRSGVAKRYLTTPAKTVLAKGLLNDGKVNNIEEGEKDPISWKEIRENNKHQFGLVLGSGITRAKISEATNAYAAAPHLVDLRFLDANLLVNFVTSRPIDLKTNEPLETENGDLKVMFIDPNEGLIYTITKESTRAQEPFSDLLFV